MPDQKARQYEVGAHTQERYTDFSKVLFLCFFYAALLPSSFIFGFAILMTQHYVRTWPVDDS